MEKFKALSPSVEVNGETILSFVNGNPAFKDSILKTLEKWKISSPQTGKWYSQQAWLDAFKEFSGKPAMLRQIGRAIPKSANFPPHINNVIDACKLLDQAYKMNHRGGPTGEYKFISADPSKKIVVMECNTPYPEEFDRGILMGLCEKYEKNIKGIPNVAIQGTRFTMTW